MQNLFQRTQKAQHKDSPLADRMRPSTFNEFYGQEELIGKNSALRKIIETDNLHSIIFWGPPGTGKTTLGHIIAQTTHSYFEKFSAVIASINDIKRAILQAQNRNQKTILFIDEIHHFNKTQQHALLPYVEDGTIILIGATTENPSFEIISPLLSRSTIFTLKRLNNKSLQKIFIRALKDKHNGLGKYKFNITKQALCELSHFADGDARIGLNALSFIADFLRSQNVNTINSKIIKHTLKKHIMQYDKRGEEHYNLISAFIKSMRASDAKASLYWLARMVKSGEDPKFIARRMVIFASEDIGNANANAINITISIARAVEFVGMPEAQINLAHGAVYLALSPKSRNTYNAFEKAKQDANKGSFSVPMHLRNYTGKHNTKNSNLPTEITETI